MTPVATVAASGVLLLLVGWRLYRRVRRLIGRQRSKTWRHAIAVVLFPVVLALLGVASSVAGGDALVGLIGGAAAGCVLAVVGLKLTRFEKTPEGWFYTPSAHIGIALSVLLVARIAYRFVQLESTLGAPVRHAASQDVVRSPLTLLVVATVLAYYAVYAAGLLRWRLATR